MATIVRDVMMTNPLSVGIVSLGDLARRSEPESALSDISAAPPTA